MPVPDDPAAFRSQATLLYQIICWVLLACVIVAGAVGWKRWSYRGLAIGVGVSAILAAIVWFAISLLWAMTQDGA